MQRCASTNADANDAFPPLPLSFSLSFSRLKRKELLHLSRVKHILLIVRSGLISGSDINTQTHTQIHTRTGIYTRGAYTAANSACIPTCGVTRSGAERSRRRGAARPDVNRICVYYTRMYTRPCAYDIPVIRVANYICRCVEPGRIGGRYLCARTSTRISAPQ